MAASVAICVYCGSETSEPHRDHVVPRSRGGPDAAFNIVMACQKCNFEKRDKLPSEWLGDKCPESVFQIESRVNQRLKNEFKKRDRKSKALTYLKQNTEKHDAK